ncbi:hypothetical protein DL546_006203 [Coniochaeta pulveracea]|uniref:OTU domain-containing protein n=1 Tax=Coniochaeta pulveracea TaxID=177199 RepID=A0A420YD51_9PEZI|nr:hypothetical protein DL546_006203 [Coniochaeta pulveracea]
MAPAGYEERATSTAPETVILIDDDDGQDSPGDSDRGMPDSQWYTDSLKPSNTPALLRWRYFVLDNDQTNPSAGKWPGPRVPDDMRFDLERFRKDYGWTSTEPGELGNFAGEFEVARRDFYHSIHDQDALFLADGQDKPEVREGWGLHKPSNSNYLQPESYQGLCQLYRGFPMVEDVTFAVHRNLHNSISGGCCYWTALALLLYGDAEQWLRVKADHLAHFGRVLVNKEHPRYELYTKLNNKMYNVRAGYPANHQDSDQLLPAFCANLWMVLKLPGVYVPMQMLDVTADLYEAYITVYSMGLEEEDKNTVMEVRTRGAYNGRHLAMMYVDGNHFRPMVPNEFLSWEFKFPRITRETTKGLPYRLGKADGVNHAWRSEFADIKLRGQKAPVIIERGFQPAAAYWAVGLVPPPKDDSHSSSGAGGGGGGGGGDDDDSSGDDEDWSGEDDWDDAGEVGGEDYDDKCEHWAEHLKLGKERNDLDIKRGNLQRKFDRLKDKYRKAKSTLALPRSALEEKSKRALDKAKTKADVLREELTRSGLEVSNLREQVTDLQNQVLRLQQEPDEACRNHSEGQSPPVSELVPEPASLLGPPSPQDPPGAPNPPPAPDTPPATAPPPAPAAKPRNKACAECGGGAAADGGGTTTKAGKSATGRGGGTAGRGGKAARGRGKAQTKAADTANDETEDKEETKTDKTDTEPTEAKQTKTKKTTARMPATKKAATKKPATRKASVRTEASTGTRTSSRLRTGSLAEATENTQSVPEAEMHEDGAVGHGGAGHGEDTAPAEQRTGPAPMDTVDEDEAQASNSHIRKLSSYSDESGEPSSPNKRRRLS